ncbi:MAG: carboxypeptidase M32, partial [Sulfobacillus sp.]
MNSDYQRLLDLLAEVSDLNAASAVLNWDELTYMPKGGAQARGEQEATLSRLAHQTFTSDQVGELLAHLEANGVGSGSEPADLVVHETRIQYDRMRLVPSEWVGRHSAAASRAYQSWAKARDAKDFSLFAPDLEIQLALAKDRGSY